MSDYFSQVHRSALTVLMLLSVVLISACANLPGGLEKPKLVIESLELLQTSAFSQRYKVGLRISNPNARELPLNGLSYDVALQGVDVISGVSAELPTIKAYSEELIYLEASTNVVQALRLLNSLLNSGATNLDYKLRAKLDLKGALPTMNVVEEGKVDLNEL